ncbi:MAG TPA: response regulator transcription factor [Polyangia bacterium]|jgi:two-component system phosphate regulon response regulator PhoB|nr:response regulator transcription factor [Polyangia bacterium]
MTATKPTERRVLVVEDEPDLTDLLTFNLQAGGYRVETANTGARALAEIDSFAPDVVLLDLMLPDMLGTEICRRIRAQPDRQQPAVIMLTAKGEEIDRVVGFEVGADDYVVKPFSMRELLLRVNACFRGAPAAAPSTAAPTPADIAGGTDKRRKYLVGPLTIDVDGHHVFVEGKEIHLSVIEMRLLTYLVEHRGRLCSRDDLLEDVWGYKPDVSTRTVDTHIKRLRDKLGAAGPLLETVRGVGYRLSDAHAVVANRE